MSAADAQVLARDCAFPEGPVFTPDGSLWWVEIHGGCLGRWRAGEVERVAVGGHPNGLAFDAAGALWICDPGERSIRRHDPAIGRTTTIADRLDGEALGKPNDLAFDAAGNLLFTCPNDARTEPVGYVCCLSPDGTLGRIADALYFPNGLALTPDGAELVVAETYRHRLWRGRWDAAARRWVDPAPWVEVGGPVGPDGLAFAADGTLYVAVFGQGCVRVIRPDGGRGPDIPVPGERPTNLAFDPSGRLGLVVTEAARGEILSFASITPTPALFTGRAS